MESESFRKPPPLGPLAFDYQSTTPCDPQVIAAMEPYWSEIFGNPSSRQHRSSLKASAVVSLAREQLADCLKITPEQLIFTSGATESNNLALLGHARARSLALGYPGHLITLATEHHSVLDPFRQLQREGFRLTELCPGQDGLLEKNQLINALEEDTILVSVMSANNEIGVIQNLGELSDVCKNYGVILHSDCSQIFGHLPFCPIDLGLDMFSLSGHKIYGPKGIGALGIISKVPILPLQWGGGQENGLRPGTIPVPLVVGFAKAADLAIKDIERRQNRFKVLQTQLWEGLIEQLPELKLNGSLVDRLPNNLNFTIPNVRGSRLHLELKSLLTCSSGSACSNGSPSHVLLALGRTSAEAASSIRLSLGRNTSSEDIREAIKVIVQVVKRLKDYD